jgi:hypothetical protein
VVLVHCYFGFEEGVVPHSQRHEVRDFDMHQKDWQHHFIKATNQTDFHECRSGQAASDFPDSLILNIV